MDTNENTGFQTPEEQEPTPKASPSSTPRASAPKMDGVSAGGRPRRPDAQDGQKKRGAPQQRKRPAAPEEKSAAPQKPRRPAEQPRKTQSEEQSRKTQREEQPRKSKSGEQPRKSQSEEPPRKTQRAEQPRKARSAGEQAQKSRSAAPGGEQMPRRKPAKAVQEPRKKQASRRKNADSGDSGYQPYRQAGRRKKAQRSMNVKTFFSAQNPVLRWFERVRYNKDSFSEDSDIAKQRRQRREAEKEKRRKRQSVFSSPAVIYTQPAAFNRDRLLVQLMTVLAVVAALMVGLSLFFKVKVITVSGTGVYSPYTIQEASGISEGENLLTLGRNRAASQILAKLPYVKSVRIGIKLPDTVNIEIVEDDVAYAIQSNTGIWWLMNSQGKVTEMVNNSIAKNYTQVLGVTLTDPAVGAVGIATELTADQTTTVQETTEGETVPEETTAPLSTVTTTAVTGAQRLSAALEILTAMEDDDIVGAVASVDVSQLDDIVLWYGTQYQVNLGDANDPVHPLSYKVACMYDAILQMTDYTAGILDVSFTTWENQVALTPFS